MLIRRAKGFLKRYKKLPLKVQTKVDAALALFFHDPQAPALRNHALSGKFLGLGSIDVTGDWRVLFRELSGGRYEIVELVAVGTHSQIYG